MMVAAAVVNAGARTIFASATASAAPLPKPQEYKNGTIRFRGVNLSGSEFGNQFYPSLVPSVPEDMESFATAGANTVRFPFRWEMAQPETMQPLATDYIAAIKGPVNSLLTSGYSVLLDLHSYMRHCSPSTGNCTIATAAQLADVWSRLLQPEMMGSLAKEFGGDGSELGPQMMFDLMNEPHDMPTQQILDNFNAAIQAVRGLGLKNLLFLEGNGWSGMHAWTQDNGPGNPPNSQVFTKSAIKDPADHYIINVHQYLDSDSSGTHPTCVPFAELPGKLNFEPFHAWLQEQGMRAFLSEFGAPYTPTCAQDMQYLLGLLSNASSAGGPSDPGFVGWTAWSAGHAWGSRYTFGLNDGDRAQAMVVAGLGAFLTPPECEAPGYILSFNGTPSGIDTGYSVQMHNPAWSDKFTLGGGNADAPPSLKCVNATRVQAGDNQIALYDEHGKQYICSQEVSAQAPILDMSTCKSS